MHQHSSTKRVMLMLFAIVQMAMPSIASIADGWLRAQSPVEAVSHAEDKTRSNCVAVHADDCALCSVIAQCAPEVAAAFVPLDTPSDAACSRRCVQSPPLHVGFLSVRPRAPPIG